jgi:hypothetical protein
MTFRLTQDRSLWFEGFSLKKNKEKERHQLEKKLKEGGIKLE